MLLAEVHKLRFFFGMRRPIDLKVPGTCFKSSFTDVVLGPELT